MKLSFPAGLSVGMLALALAAGCSAEGESSTARGLGDSPSASGDATDVPAGTTPEQAAVTACDLVSGVVGPIVGAEGEGVSLDSQPEIVALLAQAAQWSAYAAASEPGYKAISAGTTAANSAVPEGFMPVATFLVESLAACTSDFPTEATASGWADAQAELRNVLDFEEEFSE